MEKRRISALEIIATVALIVIAATVVVLFFFPSFKCDPGKCEAMKSEVIAAWVQAVGSIIALGIAIWIPANQRKHDDIANSLKEFEAACCRARRLEYVAAELAILIARIHSTAVAQIALGEVAFDRLMFGDILGRLSDLEREGARDGNIAIVAGLRMVLSELHDALVTTSIYHPLPNADELFTQWETMAKQLCQNAVDFGKELQMKG